MDVDMIGQTMLNQHILLCVHYFIFMVFTLTYLHAFNFHWQEYAPVSDSWSDLEWLMDQISFLSNIDEEDYDPLLTPFIIVEHS